MTAEQIKQIRKDIEGWIEPSGLYQHVVDLLAEIDRLSGENEQLKCCSNCQKFYTCKNHYQQCKEWEGLK